MSSISNSRKLVVVRGRISGLAAIQKMGFRSPTEVLYGAQMCSCVLHAPAALRVEFSYTP